MSDDTKGTSKDGAEPTGGPQSSAEAGGGEAGPVPADGEVRQQFSVCFACRVVGGDLVVSNNTLASGAGVPCLLAIHQDPTGDTRDLGLAYAPPHRAHRIRAVLVVHNETATGVTSDVGAVREALDGGAIAADRYESYLALLEELEALGPAGCKARLGSCAKQSKAT